MKIQDITKEQAKWIYEHALQSATNPSICFVQMIEINAISDILYKYSLASINAEEEMVFLLSREFLDSLYDLANEKKDVHVHRINICLN